MNKNEIYTAFFIAKKNILRNKGVLIFTIFIISLGFISSIIIYGALQDTSYDLQENYIETIAGHITLEPYDDKEKIENVENVLKKVKVLPKVLGAAAITEKSARLYDSNGDYIDTEIYVVDSEKFSYSSVVPGLFNEGDWLSKGEKDKIVLGCMNIKKCNEIEAFDTIDINVGESFLVAPTGYESTELVLKGIYDHRFIDIERISYVNKETANEIFGDYDSSEADKIIIRLSEREYTEETIEELNKMNLNLKISDWKEETSKHSSVIDSFLIIGDLSFFIGVIISAISIYVILYINIMNKKRQISIIKAMGIKSRVVALSYVFLSLFLGVLGSIAGIFLTLLMIEYFKFNPIQTGIGDLVPRVTPEVFSLVTLAIISVSIISGYLVSKKVTKQNIIEGIFYG